MNITSDSEGDGVTVTLHWNQENTLISYNVIIIPQLGVIFIDKTVVQLSVKVPYNILYNVSPVSISPCKQSNVISYIELIQ